jgi:hypothetical protein
MTRQKGKRKTKGIGQTGKDYEEVGLQKAPHYKTRSKTILKMPKVEIPNRNFSVRSNPLLLFRRTFKG